MRVLKLSSDSGESPNLIFKSKAAQDVFKGKLGRGKSYVYR